MDDPVIKQDENEGVETNAGDAENNVTEADGGADDGAVEDSAATTESQEGNTDNADDNDDDAEKVKKPAAKTKKEPPPTPPAKGVFISENFLEEAVFAPHDDGDDDDGGEDGAGGGGKKSNSAKERAKERAAAEKEAWVIEKDPSVVTTAFLIRKALKYSYNPKRDKEHPVVKLLDDLQERPDVGPGWLRKNEATAKNKPPPEPRTFLVQEERELLLKLALILKPIVHQTTSKLAFAWGITRNSVNNIINRACQSGDLSVNRKKRSDYGETIENSSRKRKSVFTPLFVFKKVKRLEHKGESLSNEQLIQMWNAAPEHEKQMFAEMAQQEAQAMLL
jgi:hypothetical protein